MAGLVTRLKNQKRRLKPAFLTSQADCNETARSLLVASEGDDALRRQVNDLA